MFVVVLTLLFSLPVQLYFDVNGTLIWDDPAGGKSVEDGIESALSKLKGYSEILDEKKLPKNEKKQLVKAWVKNENLQNLVQETLDAALQPGEHLTPHGTLFPSFVHLLKQLEEKSIEHNICLRTFGHDGERLAKMIEHIRPQAKFQFAHFVGEHKIQMGATTIEGVKNIIDFIHQTPYLVLQDHYSPWKNNDEHWIFGKPFYFDHPESISFFFDDNANSKSLESRNDIVCPINSQGEKIHPFHFYLKNIFPVITFEAGTNKEYYTDLVFQLL